MFTFPQFLYKFFSKCVLQIKTVQYSFAQLDIKRKNKINYRDIIASFFNKQLITFVRISFI